ncbi:hypothetical protein IAQ61_003960 [Plenodomus lingam]|uniref:uncharacterized protein n=1 Tax=Leptosphaeria maculans TaxID=5022 RepID=UPI00331AD93D|nr:hypothetical protein IAQ61_003960 [Plenodomus lingam]
MVSECRCAGKVPMLSSDLSIPKKGDPDIGAPTCILSHISQTRAVEYDHLVNQVDLQYSDVACEGQPRVDHEPAT